MMFKKICSMIIMSCFTLNVSAQSLAPVSSFKEYAELNSVQKKSLESLLEAYKDVANAVPEDGMGFWKAHYLYSDFSRSIDVMTDVLFDVYKDRNTEVEFEMTIHAFIVIASEQYKMSDRQVTYINMKIEEELREMNGSTVKTVLAWGALTAASVVVLAFAGSGLAEKYGSKVNQDDVAGFMVGGFLGLIVGVVGGKILIDYANFAEPEPFRTKLYLPSEVMNTSELIDVTAE